MPKQDIDWIDWISAAAVFGMSPETAAKQTKESLRRRHRALSMAAHPDLEGGDIEEIQKINHANDVLLAWIEAEKLGAGAANDRRKERQQEPLRPPPDPPPRQDSQPEPGPGIRSREWTITGLPPTYYVAGIATILLIASFVWPMSWQNTAPQLWPAPLPARPLSPAPSQPAPSPPVTAGPPATYFAPTKPRPPEQSAPAVSQPPPPPTAATATIEPIITSSVPSNTVVVYGPVPLSFNPNPLALMARYIARQIEIVFSDRRPERLETVQVEVYTLRRHYSFIPAGSAGEEARRILNDRFRAFEDRNRGQYILVCSYWPASRDEAGYTAVFWYRGMPGEVLAARQNDGDPFRDIKAARPACPLTTQEAKSAQ
jgi:hypothetical protein